MKEGFLIFHQYMVGPDIITTIIGDIPIGLLAIPGHGARLGLMVRPGHGDGDHLGLMVHPGHGDGDHPGDGVLAGADHIMQTIAPEEDSPIVRVPIGLTTLVLVETIMAEV